MMELMYGRLDLDRAHEARGEAEALSLSPDARFTVVWRELSLVRADGGGAALIGADQARSLFGAETGFEPVFLGLAGGQPRFAVDVSHLEGGDHGPDLVGPDLVGDAVFKPLRAHGPHLPVEEGALLAYARAMVVWHRSHRFCGLCGAPTMATTGGHVRACANPQCGREHYPRTDPAVIMLVEKEDRILLHRQSVWPQGMWSCLAGFVEPGETLEDAVRREVREESGIEVGGLRYVESQPWPFPSSLMVAFTARATGGKLAPDTTEIEDARWYGLDELLEFKDENRRSGAGPFLAMPGTVARRMVDRWIASQAAERGLGGASQGWRE